MTPTDREVGKPFLADKVHRFKTTSDATNSCSRRGETQGEKTVSVLISGLHVGLRAFSGIPRPTTAVVGWIRRRLLAGRTNRCTASTSGISTVRHSARAGRVHSRCWRSPVRKTGDARAKGGENSVAMALRQSGVPILH